MVSEGFCVFSLGLVAPRWADLRHFQQPDFSIKSLRTVDNNTVESTASLHAPAVIHRPTLTPRRLCFLFDAQESSWQQFISCFRPIRHLRRRCNRFNPSVDAERCYNGTGRQRQSTVDSLHREYACLIDDPPKTSGVHQPRTTGRPTTADKHSQRFVEHFHVSPRS